MLHLCHIYHDLIMIYLLYLPNIYLISWEFSIAILVDQGTSHLSSVLPGLCSATALGVEPSAPHDNM